MWSAVEGFFCETKMHFVMELISKKAGLEINSSETEEISVNTIVNQRLRLNGEDIKRSSDFC